MKEIIHGNVISVMLTKFRKLIGVQSNHGVEYFGGPAAPTLRFLHNRNQQFLHNQWFPHNILMAATSLGRCCHQQEKRACSQHIVITRFASQEVSYRACRQRLLEKWAFSIYVHTVHSLHTAVFWSISKFTVHPALSKKSIENSEVHGSTGKNLESIESTRNY